MFWQLDFRLSSAWQRINRPRPYPLWLLQLITEPHSCCSSIGLDFGTWQMHNWILGTVVIGYQLKLKKIGSASIAQVWPNHLVTGRCLSVACFLCKECPRGMKLHPLGKTSVEVVVQCQCLSCPFILLSWIWLGKSWKLWHEHCWVTQVKPHSSQRWPPNYLPHLFFRRFLMWHWLRLVTIGCWRTRTCVFLVGFVARNVASRGAAFKTLVTFNYPGWCLGTHDSPYMYNSIYIQYTYCIRISVGGVNPLHSLYKVYT